jgi:hypothetical protein
MRKLSTPLSHLHSVEGQACACSALYIVVLVVRVVGICTHGSWYVGLNLHSIK